MTSIVRSILGKVDEARTVKERSILAREIGRFGSMNRDHVYACVAFVLGHPGAAHVPLLAAYEAAKVDMHRGCEAAARRSSRGSGACSTRARPREEVLRITAANLTRGAAARRCRSAPRRPRWMCRWIRPTTTGPPLRLRLRDGHDAGDRESAPRARPRRRPSPSRSATGRLAFSSTPRRRWWVLSDQKLRPMATALALRDMLQHTARARVVVTGGDVGRAEGMLVRPAGDTASPRASSICSTARRTRCS